MWDRRPEILEFWNFEMRLRHISFFEILETWNFNLGENLIFHPPTSKSLTFYKKSVLIYFVWSSSVICSSISRGSNVECDKLSYTCTTEKENVWNTSLDFNHYFASDCISKRLYWYKGKLADASHGTDNQRWKGTSPQDCYTQHARVWKFQYYVVV